jgi:hypothetical protein
MKVYINCSKLIFINNIIDLDDNCDEDDIFDEFMKKENKKKETNMPIEDDMNKMSIKEPKPVQKATPLTHILPNENNNNDNIPKVKNNFKILSEF